MKKIIIGIIGVLLLTFIFGGNDRNKYVSLNLKDSLLSEGITPSFQKESSDESEVKIYLFRGDGCSHCRDFLKYLNEIEKEHGDKFQLISYEVWGNTANNKLKSKVAEELNISQSGVPLIVIGEKYYVGFGESSEKTIVDTINNEYTKKTKIDVVYKLANEKTSDNTLLYILLGVLAIAVSYETYKYIKAKNAEKKELQKKEERKIQKAQKKQKK